MKNLFTALLGLTISLTPVWELDFEKAKQTALNDRKYIFLNFSGSDWCGPCIQMHKDIFDKEVFKEFARENLVLVNADFPRASKHSLTREQQKKNDQLAENYNKNGVFPLTLLLTAEGKVIKTWEGFPTVTADEFTRQVQSLINAGK